MIRRKILEGLLIFANYINQFYNMKVTFFAFIISSSLLFMNSSCQAAEENSNGTTEQNSDETSTNESNGGTEGEVFTTNSTEENNIPPSGLTGVKVKMKTNMGDVTILLYDETPLHRDNFIKLVKDGFYDGLLFHRVIKEFMIQGGDPESKNAAPGTQLGAGGPGYTIPNEIQPGLYHKKGALSAARQGDNVNPEMRSSGSQFYIVTGKVASEQQLKSMAQTANQKMEDQLLMKFLQDPANKIYADKQLELQKLYQSGVPENQKQAEEDWVKLIEEIKPLAFKGYEPFEYTAEQIKVYTTVGGTPFLDNNYTVFGEVIEGLDIVDMIGVVPTIPGDRPKEDVIILSMEIVE